MQECNTRQGDLPKRTRVNPTVTAEGLRPVQACYRDHIHTPAPEPRLTHLHGDWRVFAQRLLRQSRVKSNLYHAGEETAAWVVRANKRRKTVGGGLQDPLLSAAPRCDALCNLGFI